MPISGTFDTTGWEEVYTKSESLTEISDIKISLTEISDSVESMTGISDSIPSFTEITDSIEVLTPLSGNVEDYSLSVTGMWDWTFMLLRWNNIGNTWSSGWEVALPESSV